MPSYVYTLNADECPAVQELADDLSLYADPPTPDTYDTVDNGAAAAQALRDKLNRNSVRSEISARFGVGAVGVLSGLELDATGLVATVSAGKANISGPVELEEDTAIALTDAAENYLWISKNGTLGKKTSADGSPLTPPDSDTDWCYLGRITVAGGSPTVFDLSGVVYLRGMPFRRTADGTTPTDTPPAGVRFLHRGASQWWLWDGTEYVEPTAESHTVVAEGGDGDPGALDAKTLAGPGISLAVVTDGVKKLRISSENFTWKKPVRAASTGNLTLSGTQTIDGVACIAGDRVLVKDQTAGAENGIYVVAAGAWSRASDADASAEVTAGMLVPVAEGTTQSNTLWVLATNDMITLGTTALVFGQFAAVRHREAFTLHLNQSAGEIREYEVDFSDRGSFASFEDYLVRCTPDQPGVRVVVLDNDRSGSSFRMQVQVAYDGDAGSYETYEDLQLAFELRGHRWTAGSSPSATPTVTADTYDYDGDGEAGGGGGGSGIAHTIEHSQATVTGDVPLGLGGASAHAGNPTADWVWKLPADPNDGTQITIIRARTIASDFSLTVEPNTGQQINGGDVASVVLDKIYECVTLMWVDSLGSWVILSHHNP